MTDQAAPAGLPWAQVTRPPRQREPAAGYAAAIAEARPDPAWDALVEAAPGGDLAQTTAWAATRQRIGHCVWHLRVAAADGAPAGGCLIQSRRVLPGVWIGAVPRGPLMFTEQPGAAERVVREMVAAARRLGIRLLVVQPPEGGAAVLDAMAAAGFRPGGPSIAPEATLRVDVRRPEEEILRDVHATRRNRIRGIMRDGLETSISDEVEVFHRLHVTSAARQGFAPIGLENLRAQWEVLAPLGRCRLLITRHGGVPLAGEWLTLFAGTLTSKLRGYDATEKIPAARNAATAATWACILQARQEGASRFDFGGFDRKGAEDVLAGRELPAEVFDTPSFFKSSFGGELALLPRPHFILTGWLARLALSGIARQLLASEAARRLAQQVRSAWHRADAPTLQVRPDH